MIEKKQTIEKSYKDVGVDPDKVAQANREKQMYAHIEMLSARIILMSVPSSNARKDAERIRRQYKMGEISC